MTMSSQKYKHIGPDTIVRSDTSGLRYGEGAPRRPRIPAGSGTERQVLLFEVASDLIRTSDLGELGRMTFEHVKSVFDAVVCTNYRLGPSLELGQEYSGTAAAGRQRLVADKQRIASDPTGSLMRELGATAYVCYPLEASDSRLLGTFAVASATRESFTDDEVAWLGTVTNLLAQAWERIEAEQALRASKDRLQLALEDLLRPELAHFADLVSRRITMHGPRLRLNPASAQAIGLALHELGTNAGKYGALSREMGRVDIGWGIDSDTFTISWTERDGPHVSAPKRRGFGTIVMETMAERSVGGKVNLGYAPTMRPPE
jgi:GAF domain-containing protein